MGPLPLVHRVDWLDSYPFNGNFNDFTGSALEISTSCLSVGLGQLHYYTLEYWIDGVV
jgi:hypothetical protein